MEFGMKPTDGCQVWQHTRMPNSSRSLFLGLLSWASCLWQRRTSEGAAAKGAVLSEAMRGTHSAIGSIGQWSLFGSGPHGDREMKLATGIALVLLWAGEGASAREGGNVTVFGGGEAGGGRAVDLHSRRKRYIVFPKGSSLQLILEHLVHVPTELEVVVGPTLQVAWPLPSEGWGRLRWRRASLPGAAGRGRGPSGPGSRQGLLSAVGALVDLFGMTVGLAWQLPDDPMIYSELKKKHKVYKRNVLKKMEAFISKPGGGNGRHCVLRALCESGQRTPSKKDFLTEMLHKVFSVEAEEQGLEESPDDRLYRKAHQSLNQNCKALYPECHFSLFDFDQ